MLVDEKHGRSAAETRGLAVIGLLGVLLMAKKAARIPSVAFAIHEVYLFNSLLAGCRRWLVEWHVPRRVALPVSAESSSCVDLVGAAHPTCPSPALVPGGFLPPRAADRPLRATWR